MNVFYRVTPFKQAQIKSFFNPINIFDTFSHSITLLYIFNTLFSFNVNFLIYRLYFKAVPVKENWEACEVGYIRHEDGVYDCPMYSTTFRGPTYIVLATLKSVDPIWKWVLAGVAMICQEDK